MIYLYCVSPAERQTSVDNILSRSPGSTLRPPRGRNPPARLLSHPADLASPPHLDFDLLEVIIEMKTYN